MEGRKYQFQPPSEQKQQEALGIMAKDTELKPYFDSITSHFKPIPEPQPDDWLWVHKEKG